MPIIFYILTIRGGDVMQINSLSAASLNFENKRATVNRSVTLTDDPNGNQKRKKALLLHIWLHTIVGTMWNTPQAG